MHPGSWTCHQQVTFSHRSGGLPGVHLTLRRFMNFISSCPVIAKAIIVLTAIMRNLVPASLTSSSHVKLSLFPLASIWVIGAVPPWTSRTQPLERTWPVCELRPICASQLCSWLFRGDAKRNPQESLDCLLGTRIQLPASSEAEPHSQPGLAG